MYVTDTVINKIQSQQWSNLEPWETEEWTILKQNIKEIKSVTKFQ